MKTIYLRNVPDELSADLEQMAAEQAMSVNALAVRELAAAVAFRRNVDIVRQSPDLELDLSDIVAAVRDGRDR